MLHNVITNWDIWYTMILLDSGRAYYTSMRFGIGQIINYIWQTIIIEHTLILCKVRDACIRLATHSSLRIIVRSVPSSTREPWYHRICLKQRSRWQEGRDCRQTTPFPCTETSQLCTDPSGSSWSVSHKTALQSQIQRTVEWGRSWQLAQHL